MSLKFQTTKWQVEITWEQLTVTPIGMVDGNYHRSADYDTSKSQIGAANYFLFDLIGQLFASGQPQERISK